MCGLIKRFSCFYRNDQGKHSYSSMCKECEKAARRQYYRQHEDKERERSRKYKRGPHIHEQTVICSICGKIKRDRDFYYFPNGKRSQTCTRCLDSVSKIRQNIHRKYQIEYGDITGNMIKREREIAKLKRLLRKVKHVTTKIPERKRH